MNNYATLFCLLLSLKKLGGDLWAIVSFKKLALIFKSTTFRLIRRTFLSQNLFIFLSRLRVWNSPICRPNFQEIFLLDEKPIPTSLHSINGAKSEGVKKSRDFHFGKFISIVASIISKNTSEHAVCWFSLQLKLYMHEAK